MARVLLDDFALLVAGIFVISGKFNVEVHNNAEKITLSFSIDEAKGLISRIDTSNAKKEKAADFPFNERIKINSE